MRYLRITAVLLFAVSVVVSICATISDNLKHDSTMPELVSAVDTLELSVNDPKEALFGGLTAQDEKDGDLTDKIMIVSKSRMLDNSTCKVKYVVFDSSNNSATLTRTVRYTDYVPPKFKVTEPLVYKLGENVRYLDRIKAEDALDGDISDKIKVKADSIDAYRTGIYPIELEVTNSYGDHIRVELNVVIADETANAPEITLSDSLVYVPLGSSFNADKYVKSVRSGDGSVLGTDSVRVSGSVDTNTAGCYPIVYSASSDGAIGQSCLTVVVTEEGAK